MWVTWTEVWESYVYRVIEYRDLGEWVLTPIDVRAIGRNGIPVELRAFEIRSVRDGMIAVTKVFGSEREALEPPGYSSTALDEVGDNRGAMSQEAAGLSTTWTSSGGPSAYERDFS